MPASEGPRDERSVTVLEESFACEYERAEDYDSICVVPPGARARLDDHGSVVIDV